MSDTKKAGLSDWIAVTAGTIGSLMATLDTSIVNSSLPTIQGEIGASQDEGTWISTAYLVAEIIMIPLAGWFDRGLGLRNFLLICVVLFTLFSVSCGLSDSLGTMIIGRLGQGFTGGALVPTALTIVATRLPPGQRPIGIALFGATAVLGPVIGPLIGGYLTENISWRYAFYVNVPIGAGLIALLIIGLPHAKVKWSVFREADPLGILGLALGLGALTTALEEGERDRWFESTLISSLFVLSFIGFVLLAAGQFAARKPIVHLKILFTRAFGSVFVLSLVVGAALYGINYMLPQFLSNLAQYNALQSGEVTLVSGIPTLLLMLVFPILVKLIDVRVAVGGGLLLYGLSCLLNTGLTTNSAGINFVVSQVIVGFGQFFSLIFLNQSSTAAVNEDLADDASGLFNAARNLGGSMGLAAISTLREQRSRFHEERIREVITNNAHRSQDFIRAISHQLGTGDPVVGLKKAYYALDQVSQSAAFALAFSDIFFVFGVLLIAAIPLVFLLRPLPDDAEMSAG